VATEKQKPTRNSAGALMGVGFTVSVCPGLDSADMVALTDPKLSPAHQ